MSVSREMPKYQCHKRVYALKIAEILPNPNPDATGRSAATSYGARIVPADPHYGTFEVDANYMNRHSPKAGGYYVVYDDGHASFSPAAAFETGYSPIAVSEREAMLRGIAASCELPLDSDLLSFGAALGALKAGFKVARVGWNGKGQFVYLVPAASYPAQTGAAKAHFGDGAMVPYNAYLALKTVDERVSTWVPSVSDCLAEDWAVVPD